MRYAAITSSPVIAAESQHAGAGLPWRPRRVTTVTATIRVGANPQGVAAADPVAHSAYVPNNAHGTVSVIDDPRFNTANGTQPGIFTCSGGANQHWKLP